MPKKTVWCESCFVTPAVTHSQNPEISGYDLCEKCAEEYDGRIKPITKVIFRKWRGECDRVLALFPEIPADIYGDTCYVYEHMGQQGAGFYDLYIQNTWPADPEEYADLKKQLEKIGYHLEVMERITPAMVEIRRRAAKEKA